MKKVQHRVVIAEHRPWRRWALIGGSAAFVLLGGWGLYSYTRANTVSEFERTQSDRDRLMDERRNLTRDLHAAHAEIDQLKDQVAYLSRSQEIDGGACTAVKQSLADMQAQDADLREQLGFYRGIVSPIESAAGVRVYEFKVSRAVAPASGYHYNLVLIQSVHHDKRIDGTLDAVFEGTRAGQKMSVKLSEVATDDKKNLLFSFRYFEEISGNFQMPEGFHPLRAKVTLVPEGDTPSVDGDFDWTKIFQETRGA